MTDDTDETRRARAKRTLAEYHGPFGEQVIARLADVAPDFADQLVDYAFGDVYSRPGLDRRSRQIATLAGLAALGNAEPQLKWHIRGALNIGITRTEVIEILSQMAIYGGFPAGVRALMAAKEVFDEIDEFATELARQDDA
jgi:4-carboxymuconolactone decarboxylase